MNPFSVVWMRIIQVYLCKLGPECEGHGLQGNIVLPTNCVILVKFLNLAGLHVLNSKIGRELQWHQDCPRLAADSQHSKKWLNYHLIFRLCWSLTSLLEQSWDCLIIKRSRNLAPLFLRISSQHSP